MEVYRAVMDRRTYLADMATSMSQTQVHAFSVFMVFKALGAWDLHLLPHSL